MKISTVYASLFTGMTVFFGAIANDQIDSNAICSLQGIDQGDAIVKYFDTHEHSLGRAGLGCFKFGSSEGPESKFVQVDVVQKKSESSVELFFKLDDGKTKSPGHSRLKLENGLFFHKLFRDTTSRHEKYIVFRKKHCASPKSRQEVCFLYNLARYYLEANHYDSEAELSFNSSLQIFETSTVGGEMTILVSRGIGERRPQLFTPANFSNREMADLEKDSFGVFPHFVSENLNWDQGSTVAQNVVSLMRQRIDKKQRFFLGAEGGGFYSDNKYCFTLAYDYKDQPGSPENAPSIPRPFLVSPLGAGSRHEESGYIDVVRLGFSGHWRNQGNPVDLEKILEMAVSSETVWWSEGWTIDPEILIEVQEQESCEGAQ